MELKEFVKNTILDIMDGVRAAQEECNNGAVIVPPIGSDGYNFKLDEQIEFDVAIIISGSKGSGRGIKVGSIIGGSLEAGDRSEHREVSRVRFSVPVTYPSS